MGTIDLVLFIARTALSVIEAHVTGKPIVIADSILQITQAAYAAYEKETGQPINPDDIKPFTPIS